MDIAAFVAKWAESSASERATKDAFLLELCDVLGVPPPRDLMMRSGASWTVEEAASSFKGARRTDVEVVLESLAALGVVLSYGDGASRKWRRVGRVAA